jgi:hypothetical protein
MVLISHEHVIIASLCYTWWMVLVSADHAAAGSGISPHQLLEGESVLKLFIAESRHISI